LRRNRMMMLAEAVKNRRGFPACENAAGRKQSNQNNAFLFHNFFP
jgi:hypothetical protein